MLRKQENWALQRLYALGMYQFIPILCNEKSNQLSKRTIYNKNDLANKICIKQDIHNFINNFFWEHSKIKQSHENQLKSDMKRWNKHKSRTNCSMTSKKSLENDKTARTKYCLNKC